jgi:hypothetical protein
MFKAVSVNFILMLHNVGHLFHITAYLILMFQAVISTSNSSKQNIVALMHLNKRQIFLVPFGICPRHYASDVTSDTTTGTFSMIKPQTAVQPLTAVIPISQL